MEASDNHDNQPVTGATKTGGGWQEGIDEKNHTATTVGDDKQRGHAADGDGSNKEGEDGKGDGDGNEGAG